MQLTVAEQEIVVAQRHLAVQAASRLHRAGHDLVIGRIGSHPETAHATIEIPMTHGRHLVLHPMGEALGLTWADVADEGVDVAVWHVLVRDEDGAVM